jgi:hypothetical protein
MYPKILVAAQKPTCPSWERVQKRIEERRAVIESARAMNVKRLQNDVQRIARREAEFAQQILQEIVPVKITWNEDAWQKLQEALPVRIEPAVDAAAPKAPEGDAPTL